MHLKMDDKRQQSGKSFNRIMKEKIFDFIRTLSNNDERKPLSAFPTSYGSHYNHSALSREPTRTSM